MKVTILGSGTAVPVADRFPAGVLVETDHDVILVDVGPGILRRLAQAGVGIERVTVVLLTHFHTDHTGDLPALFFALRNPRYDGRRPPLRVVGAEGLRRLVSKLDDAWTGKLAARGYELHVDEVGPGRVELGGGVTATAFAIRHTAQSLAWRIEEPSGRVLAVSGDATPCDGLVDVARGADLFVCEAAFPDEEPNERHLTPRLAGEAAALAGARRLVLTHFYPECEGHDLLGQARATFRGDVVLAEDLMSFTL